MASRTPGRVRIRDNGRVVGPDVGTLAASLKRSRYATGAFVSGYPLAAMFGLGLIYIRLAGRHLLRIEP